MVLSPERPSLVGRTLARLAALSVERPRTVIALLIAATLAFALQLPAIRTDTDPKHMLPESSPVRVYNDAVEKDFALHADVIVVGIVNEAGVLAPGTLARIQTLTVEIEKLPGVIARDVASLSTIDDIVATPEGLDVRPLMERLVSATADAERRRILVDPLFVGRILAADGTATAIYVPIDPGANGREIAARVRERLPRAEAAGGDVYYVTGDPVTRDTFGAEMFRQMALFSPIAGLVMCLVLWLMFRSAAFVVVNMVVAMASIVWCMGLLVGVGLPVHIMSSMSPVFLMAIATDSVHIMNELAFRFAEVKDKKRAILDTMAAVGGPVFFSDVTTAVGFASLASTHIVPVRIFGIFVAFGTLAILLMSFTLVPAILMLLHERHIPAPRGLRDAGTLAPGSVLHRLGPWCVSRARGIALAAVAVLALSGVGLARIRVNNNMVHWFKVGSPIREADRVLASKLGGTSTAYLVVEAGRDDAMKDPAMLRAIDELARSLQREPRVGKTFSLVDYVKRVNRVLHGDDPAFDRVPDTADEVGQYLFLFGTSAKPSDLDNVVDYPYRRANLRLWLRSWDAGVMADVMRLVEAHLRAHPLPGGAIVKPAGIAHFNRVWSDEVLWGMLESFLAGLVLVLLLLAIQERSLPWGALSFLPLLVTIAVIYGVVGFAGKDFDMPVAVLSTLSLGMAVDFAIHFVGRFRQRHREGADLDEALVWTVARPGRGIFQNAILFAVGFAVMVLADLTPYVTVGVLMMAIMLLSATASVILLPALIKVGSRFLLKGPPS